MAYSLKDLVTTEKILTPPRIVIYGGQGIGKSTWAAQFPKPIFVLTETGVDNIKTNKLPMCKSWEDLISQLTMIEFEDHDYKTIVIDTVSGMEKLIEQKVCNENKNAVSVASVPFGKGYGEATTHFNNILKQLERIREGKKMMVVLIGHEKLEEIKSPDMEGYQRYTIDLDKRVVPDLNRWVDVIFFVRHKIFTKKVEESFGKDVHQAVGGRERVLLTEEQPAYVAKNRYDLPKEFAFEKEGCVKAILKAIQGNFNKNEPVVLPPVSGGKAKKEIINDPRTDADITVEADGTISR